MALGTPLFAGLVRANCTVTIQVATAAPTGGTQVTWSTLKSGVPVLLTTTSGSRQYPLGTFDERVDCKIAGKEPLLQRDDIRLYVTAAGPGVAAFVGRYLAVASGQGHSRGAGGVLRERVNLNCTVLQVPADGGSAL